MHYLILPGWQNSGPAHWQSLWEAQLPAQRVMQHDWMRPLRGDWITHLEDHVLSINEHSAQETCRPLAQKALKTEERDIIFIAHSLGCHLVAAWAALSKQTHRIKGALLVAPPDGIREAFPPELKSWRPPVLHKLSFPSICVISSNDPFCDLQPGKDMAAAWGSELLELGDKGHINADSGIGDWSQGRELLARLAS
ncbi:MAG: alpha/beta hydrolase [Burkholderiales bacterium]|nr:MAG: alpha/beta hydrolase [Burkholderiales bacterium]